MFKRTFSRTSPTLLCASAALSLGVLTSQAAAQDAKSAASPHTLTGNASLVSDYRFRGISQTFKSFAFQGGADYSHSSGLYAGNWNSNVSEGAGYPRGNLEMDFYGGYKLGLGDTTLDFGAIHYYYPGSNARTEDGTVITSAKSGSKTTYTGSVNNTEAYIGASYKFVSLKVSYALSDYFSVPDTAGTIYVDLSANYDLGSGWGVNAHVGTLNVAGAKYAATTDGSSYGQDPNYTDWKIGATKDVGGWVFGLAAVGTDAKGDCSKVDAGTSTSGQQPYCFNNGSPLNAKTNASAVGAVASIAKTF